MCIYSYGEARHTNRHASICTNRHFVFFANWLSIDVRVQLINFIVKFSNYDICHHWLSENRCIGNSCTPQLHLDMIHARDVKRSSNFWTLNYMFEIGFEFLNSEFKTKLNCTLKQTWALSLSHNVCQRDAISLFFADGCRPPLRPSIDTAAVVLLLGNQCQQLIRIRPVCSLPADAELACRLILRSPPQPLHLSVRVWPPG